MIEIGVRFAIGLVLLVFGSKFLVDSGVRLAKKLGVSDFIIGLTFVAVGTGIPELSNAVFASVAGYPELVVGNVIGSNMANMLLVLGISAIIMPIAVHRKVFERDGYLMVLSALMVYAFAIDGVVSRIEATMMFLMYVVYILFLVKTRNGSRHRFRDFLGYVFGFRYVLTVKSRYVEAPHTVGEEKVATTFREGVLKDILIIGLAAYGVVMGAQWVVNGAVWFAGVVGVPNSVVALSVVSVGTTLPELFVGVAAARRKLGGFVVGNAIGSNIANSLLFISVASFVKPLAVSALSVVYLLPVVAFVTVAFVYLIRYGKLKRWTGASLVLVYVVFILYALLLGVL